MSDACKDFQESFYEIEAKEKTAKLNCRLDSIDKQQLKTSLLEFKQDILEEIQKLSIDIAKINLGNAKVLNKFEDIRIN